jgi:hypothetical protein
MLHLLTGLAFATPSIGVQGQLSDADGSPADGSRTVIFRLYTAEGTAAASAPFTEPVLVTFSGGAFSAQIGLSQALPDGLLAGDLWLGVQLGDAPESERVMVGWAPRAVWAARAGDADAINGRDFDALQTTFDGRYAPATGAGYVALDPASPQTGGATLTGAVTAGSFVGSGAGLTGLSAGQLTGTVAVARGGTGLTSATANALLLGGGAGAFGVLGGLGTAGQVLTSAGPGGPPVWSAAGSSSQWATNGANISYSAGNVAIGGTAAAASLDLSARTDAVILPRGTTAERPASPVLGAMRVNTSLNALEFYTGSGWSPILSYGFTATGGVVTDIPGYRVHTYTSSGTFTAGATGGNVEVLVVGGGGGGGSDGGEGGGGGGGGVVYAASYSVAASQAISVVVGGGGTGASSYTPRNNSSGANSTFGAITAFGGGSGGCYPGDNRNGSGTGAAGGSGGGGGGNFSGTDFGHVGGATSQTSNGGGTGYGNAGATGVIGTLYLGGGGGGAGGAGFPGSGSTGGTGGPGLSFSISGNAVHYGAGGAGGSNGGPVAQGGLGGGGNEGVNGVAGTGGGGGAASPTAVGNGGSGVVIVRYPR